MGGAFVGGEGGEEGCGAREGAENELDAVVVIIGVVVLVGEVGDGEGIEAEFLVGGSEGCVGEGEVDVLPWVEGLL